MFPRMRKLLTRVNYRSLRGQWSRLRRRLARTVLKRLGGVPREEFECLLERVAGIDLGPLYHQQRLHSNSIAWLAQSHGHSSTFDSELPPASQEPALQPGPLVSVLMACWNRAHMISAAIDTVLAQSYTRWELIVIDDGSTDDLAAALAPYAGDSRIRFVRQDHAGLGTARNYGLRESAGEVIAYLDTDNQWYPHYLAQVVQAFAEHPEQECLYFAQLYHDRGRYRSWVQAIQFDHDSFIREGGIDINTFAHRRNVYEREGGFSQELTRLTDWDFIGRYTRTKDPLAVPRISGDYYVAEPDSITANVGFAYNAYLVQKALLPPAADSVRVLYLADGHESARRAGIRTEIACLRRWGVEVEVWSRDPALGRKLSPQIVVHSGTLEVAIESFRPHLVHAVGLPVASRNVSLVAEHDLSMTVRDGARSPDVRQQNTDASTSSQLLKELQQNEAVSQIFAFPNNMAEGPLQKVTSLLPAFDGQRFSPSRVKDPRLVLQRAEVLLDNDLFAFVEVAKRCPQHRFVLCATTVARQQDLLQKLEARNRSLASPVEILVDPSQAKIDELTAKAGIYLHTRDQKAAYEMSPAIAEAMATGAFVIDRMCDSARDFIGDAGAVCKNAHEAAELILSTLDWSDEQWTLCRGRSTERAFAYYSEVKSLRPVFDHWCELASKTDTRSSRPSTAHRPSEAA